MPAFRILSLDGGGMMGAFSASVLSTYERQLKKRHPDLGLADHFDLITGTSTGGIIAIALAMGSTAEEVLGFYRDKGAKIFPRSAGIAGWFGGIRSLFGPKFGTEELRKAITDVVGAKTLEQAQTRLVIPSYDASLGRVYLFKTPHHADCTQDRNLPAADAAMATSAAPTYFPAHTIPDRGVFIDGGIWGNCPAVIGIIEALSFCGQHLDDVHVLSLSTTNYPFKIGAKQQLGGLVGWGPKILETFMFSQAQAAVAGATSLLRDHQTHIDRFHRIDYITEPRVYAMDDTTAVSELINIGRGVAEKVENRTVVEREFLNGQPAPRIQPA